MSVERFIASSEEHLIENVAKWEVEPVQVIENYTSQKRSVRRKT
jgi:hypothetical protein